MPLPSSFLNNLYLAIGIGLATAVLLAVLRRVPAARRVRRSAGAAAAFWGLYLILRGLEAPGADSAARFLMAAGWLVLANIALQSLDIVFWSRSRAPRLLVEIFNVIVMLGAALSVLRGVFGVDLSGLVVTSTVLSAVIGLALQDMLSNAISGVAIQLDRPFDVADWIAVNGQEGEVVRMNWRTITLRNVDNQYIIVPNANMVRTDVTNYSRPTAEQRLHVRIGLPYATPPGTVKEVLLPAVQGAEGVSASPAPDVLAYEYGDSAILYDVRYWITDYSRAAEIRDAVLSRIWYALRRAGISVPFPIRDVTVRQVSDEQEQAAAARLRQRIFEHLRPLPLFAPFADEQVAQLAAHAKIQPYAAGEMLVTQGEVGDSLFVILSGQARVDVESASGAVSTLARRGPDDYFGEMSLLTGERRTASVIAESEMDVIIVDKTALADVLNANPESLRELSELAAQRLAEMRAHLDAAEATGSRKDADSGTGLFSRIARFLGLDKA